MSSSVHDNVLPSREQLGNLTVACGAICEHEGKILMVQEYRPDEGHVLNQPVGKLKLGENILEATKRELQEETGLVVELIYFLGTYVWLLNNGNTSIRFCFIATPISGELRQEPRTDDEIVQPIWLSPAELQAAEKKFRNPVTKKCLEDYYAGKKYPLDTVITLYSHKQDN